MNQKLETIADKAADDLKGFIRESERAIEEAMSECAEESAVQDAPMKFRMALTIVLDLDKHKQENTLTWNVRHKLSSTSEIEDPKQIKMSIGSN